MSVHIALQLKFGSKNTGEGSKSHFRDIASASLAGIKLFLHHPPKPSTSQPQSRGLEDNEDLLVCDLDAEELFRREYDLLDERDNTVDYLD